MRHWLAGLAIFVCAAVPLGGQTEEWRTYRNTAGNFSALMPGEPQVTTPNATAHTIRASSGGLIYIVVYTQPGKDHIVTENAFKVYRESFFKQMPECEIVSEGPAVPEVAGYLGRHYRLVCTKAEKKSRRVGNLYWGRRYSYVVMAMFPDVPRDPENVRMFVNSFAQLGRDK